MLYDRKPLLSSSPCSSNCTPQANNLYSALVQFYQLFPELQQNEFYVTGESYVRLTHELSTQPTQPLTSLA